MALRPRLDNKGASATTGTGGCERARFPVPIDHDIGEDGAVRGVEQLRTGSQLDEHGGLRYAGRPVGGLSGCDVRSDAYGSTGGVDAWANAIRSRTNGALSDGSMCS